MVCELQMLFHSKYLRERVFSAFPRYQNFEKRLSSRGGKLTWSWGDDFFENHLLNIKISIFHNRETLCYCSLIPKNVDNASRFSSPQLQINFSPSLVNLFPKFWYLGIAENTLSRKYLEWKPISSSQIKNVRPSIKVCTCRNACSRSLTIHFQNTSMRSYEMGHEPGDGQASFF